MTRKIVELGVELGPLTLRSPLIGASGTVGSVVDFVGVSVPAAYGAMVAKSVAGKPWAGRAAPRIAPAGVGMINGIGIQNPGIDAWVAEVGPQIASAGVPVWGSSVGTESDEFALVSKGLEAAGVQAVEINLSCPNLHGGGLIAFDPGASAAVVSAVRGAISVPIGAKLAPDASSIAEVAGAVAKAGADWVVVANTAMGAAIDIETRRPKISGFIGGYSGPPLKPIALRCVVEIHRQHPELAIIGCGGVMCGKDVIEYLMAGASAVAVGTAHFAEPKVGKRLLAEIDRWCRRHKIGSVRELVGTVQEW